jgi:L-ascorbate metabolism protein UlaG (beta-lactamase superfamily)
MHVEWYGQSSFALRDADTTVFIDLFGDISPAASARSGGERLSERG